MGRQFVIAAIAIAAALTGLAIAAVGAATWLQRERGDQAEVREPDAFGTIASFVTGEAFVWDDQTEPMTVGPGTITLQDGVPLDVPARTPLHGNGCDVLTPGLPTSEGPPPPGTELITPDLAACVVQLGLEEDDEGRVAWLLGFLPGVGTVTLTGELREADAEAERLVLTDGSTVPAAAPPVVGCDALEITTLEEIIEFDAEVEIRVDPATGAAVEVACVQ